MSELEMANDVEPVAEAFADELSDEALDRQDGAGRLLCICQTCFRERT
jgi:hypothetical protein